MNYEQSDLLLVLLLDFHSEALWIEFQLVINSIAKEEEACWSTLVHTSIASVCYHDVVEFCVFLVEQSMKS